MKIDGPAVRFTAFVGEDDTWHHAGRLPEPVS
jgi:hypothetical protein